MPTPARDTRLPWVVQDLSDAYRVVDAAGGLIGEIRFGALSGSSLSRDEAREMAHKMVDAAEVLAASAGAVPDTSPTSERLIPAGRTKKTLA